MENANQSAAFSLWVRKSRFHRWHRIASAGSEATLRQVGETLQGEVLVLPAGEHPGVSGRKRALERKRQARLAKGQAG